MAIQNLDFLAFISTLPIDKISHVDTISISNPGPRPVQEREQSARIITGQKSHPVGRRCFIRARWNVDGGDWQDMGNILGYQFTFSVDGTPMTTLTNRIGQISIGCDANNVYVRTANGHHGDVNMNGGSGALSYTTIPHTYNIEYVLYEMS